MSRLDWPVVRFRRGAMSAGIGPEQVGLLKSQQQFQ